MGYCVSMSCNVEIPADKVEAALAAINALHTPDVLKKFATGGSWNAGSRVSWHYSWVPNPPEGGFPSLVKALRAWRYAALDAADGSVYLEYFEGEKLGDDEVLWDALAPYVADGSSIECRGEDDVMWRWIFEDGQCVEQRGKVVYE